MPNFFIIFIGFSLIIGSSGCIHFWSDTLSDEEIEWIDNPSRNPAPYFESNLGNKARLFYTERHKRNTNPIFSNASANYTLAYEGYAWYEFSIKSKRCQLKGKFRMDRNSGKSNISTTLGSLSNYRLSHSKIATFDYNGKIIDNCLVIANGVDQSHQSTLYSGPISKEDTITKFVISKDYGPIYFRYNDGEEFFRIFQNIDSIKPKK